MIDTAAAKPRTRVWPALILAVLTAALLVPAAPVQSTAGTDLDGWLQKRVAAMDPSDPYRAPTLVERTLGATELTAMIGLGEGAGNARLSTVGLSATSGQDAGSGRSYTLLASKSDDPRAWGAVLIDRSAPLSTVIEVPHPANEPYTATMGLHLFRKVPGAALVIAGGHRRASGGAADVARHEPSMFQTYVSRLLTHGAKREVQLHGFAAASLPGVDVIASQGPTTTTSAHKALASRVSAKGLAVCAGWSAKCGELRGKTNLQGLRAADRGNAFLHLEMSPRVRWNATLRSQVISSLASTWGA